MESDFIVLTAYELKLLGATAAVVKPLIPFCLMTPDVIRVLPLVTVPKNTAST